MSRQHPLFSPLGCLGGLVLIAGILATVWFSGGAIFSPGELTAYAQGQPINGFTSHADFQNDCTQCHVAFQGTAPEKCEVCHINIAEERAAGTGLHGKLKPEEAAACETCHTDHKGRDLDPNANAVKKFDHAILGFTLVRHVVNYDASPLSCTSCHASADFQFEAAACVTCHGASNVDFMLGHVRAFGQECRACHDGVDKTSNFDHAQTQFPLEGKHIEVECAACHKPEIAPQAAPVQCAACHAESPGHANVFTGQDCATCHTPTTWSPVKLGDRPRFQHANTAFQLVNHAKDYGGSPITCTACHAQASAGDFTAATQMCVDCHAGSDAAFMTVHVQKYGMNCISCHDGSGNMQNFDHSRIFVLDGDHAALACMDCHKEQKFRGTPRECVACHQEPQIHAGIFGTQCEACHTTTAWVPAHLTRHTFPLDHGNEGEIACATCHMQSYAVYTCSACHDQAEMQSKHVEEGITGDRLLECAACHPTGHGE